MLKQIKNKIKGKKGYATIIAIVSMAIILPLLLFLVVDMPYYLNSNRQVKSIVDNTAAGASTILREDMLAEGILIIDEDLAETYILEDLAVWFNLEDRIYETNVDGVKAMKRKTGVSSYFNTDPLIIRIEPDTNITDENVLKASKVEYFIHDTKGKSTYTFTSGQKITVSTPTVGVKVSTKTRGLLFKIPIQLIKLGTTEVVFDAHPEV